MSEDRKNRTPDDARTDTNSAEPFRESGSGTDYDPAGNWGAERRRDGPSGGASRGMEGAPSGAGDGGFGPEGDYRGAAGQPNADVLGQTRGDNSELVDEAQELGRPRPGRKFVGGSTSDTSNATRKRE